MFIFRCLDEPVRASSSPVLRPISRSRQAEMAQGGAGIQPSRQDQEELRGVSTEGQESTPQIHARQEKQRNSWKVAKRDRFLH